MVTKDDILKVVTGQWRDAKEIALDANTKPRFAIDRLMQLEFEGEVEQKYESDLNARFWRLKQKGFVPSWMLKKEEI
jgi:hypothetical protein